LQHYHQRVLNVGTGTEKEEKEETSEPFRE
jgi:hypothetical protein